MSEALDRVLGKFPDARHVGDGQYTACCPAHDDQGTDELANKESAQPHAPSPSPQIRRQLIHSFPHAALSPEPDLAVAALMIARVEYPRLDAGPYLDQLDAIGREARLSGR